MSEISVDFLLGPGPLSWLIAWDGLGFGGFSHAASVLADGRYLDARSDAMHGVPAGVHIRMPGYERSIRRTRATIEVTQAEYDDWEANLRAKIGTPYSKRVIWGYISGRKEEVKGRWICSELAVNALQHIGKVRYPLQVPAHQISPDTLFVLMDQIGATFTDMQSQLIDIGEL